MANVIIVVLVVLLMIWALKGTVKHFKGEGPCCSGGSHSLPPVEDKKLKNPIIGTKTVHISGMHCQHCVDAVTRAINKNDGMSAKVSLKKERAVVSFDREIDESILRGTVEKAGYQVISIESR